VRLVDEQIKPTPPRPPVRSYETDADGRVRWIDPDEQSIFNYRKW
jgi:hypothetical protein